MRVSIGPKPFLHGLLVGAFTYAAVFAYVFTQTPKTFDQLEKKLAHLSVPIERDPVIEPLEAVPVITTPLPAMPTPVPAADINAGVSIPTTGPLPAAPVEGLYEKTPAGLMPQKGPNNLTPFSAYRRPFIVTGNPIIAILVDDFGLSDSASLKAVSLPPEVSFLLSSYSGDAQKWAQDARQSGHEIWMKVNFETASYPDSDPGPQALLSNASLKYNEDRLIWNLTRASGYAGIAGGTDYIFESASSILQPLIKSIYGRGLAYLETNSNASSLVETLAVTAEAPYAKADTVITGNDTHDPFGQLERTALERGFAIGVLKPTEAAYAQFKKWSDNLASKNIQLAPVSAIAALPLAVNGVTVEETEEVAPVTAVPVEHAEPPAAEAH